MLEGKEVEGSIGDKGAYSVDVDGYGLVRAEASYKMDSLKGGAYMEMHIIELLKMLALKTENQIDDKAIAIIDGLLPKRPEAAPAEPAE